MAGRYGQDIISLYFKQKIWYGSIWRYFMFLIIARSYKRQQIYSDLNVIRRGFLHSDGLVLNQNWQWSIVIDGIVNIDTGFQPASQPAPSGQHWSLCVMLSAQQCMASDTAAVRLCGLSVQWGWTSTACLDGTQSPWCAALSQDASSRRRALKLGLWCRLGVKTKTNLLHRSSALCKFGVRPKATCSQGKLGIPGGTPESDPQAYL